MADERLIPNRPIPDDSKIPAADKDMLSYSIAFAVPNQKAFALWHPEFLDSSGKLNKTGRAACTQFFNYAKNREYADAYKRTLAEFLERKDRDVSIDAELSEDRIDNAYKNLLRLAIEDLERGNVVDNDTYKLYMELFKKLGRFKDDVEEQEAPRRYLPERCSACSYRSFVEGHVESGEIVNECDFCRTRRFAEENGWHYDPTKNLDLPKEDND
jgi:hypothetical protein